MAKFTYISKWQSDAKFHENKTLENFGIYSTVHIFCRYETKNFFSV